MSRNLWFWRASGVIVLYQRQYSRRVENSMSSQNRAVLIIGATGKQGGATARRLLAGGWPARALVRSPHTESAQALASAGAELVTGDLDDPASLTTALAGMYGVFAIPPVAYGPSGIDADLEAARGRALVDAAAAAGVEHVVFSGVATLSGGAVPHGSGKHHIEAHLRQSGLTATVLRPVRFMSNYLSTGLPVDGIQDGVHRHLFTPDEPVQVIAVTDIAEFAAMAFADPGRFGGRTLELAGDAPTPTVAAAAISEATGLTIRYVQISRAEAESGGYAISQTRDLWERGHRWHADIEVLRVLHPGMLTLEDWLERGGAEQIRKQAGTPRMR
jgi:uncharacterized protein YbjT (DUF2867 family)